MLLFYLFVFVNGWLKRLLGFKSFMCPCWYIPLFDKQNFIEKDCDLSTSIWSTCMYCWRNYELWVVIHCSFSCKSVWMVLSHIVHTQHPLTPSSLINSTYGGEILDNCPLQVMYSVPNSLPFFSIADAEKPLTGDSRKNSIEEEECHPLMKSKVTEDARTAVSPQQVKIATVGSEQKAGTDYAVEIEEGCFCWGNQKEILLKDINFKAKAGE